MESVESKYGHFSPDGSEFIITTPHTPRPWVNYLTNGDYCALCSHMGGGFSFYKDHRLNSVLRRGQFVHLQDLPARLVYIKDEDTGEIWTANVLPIGKYDRFEARHGMNYTTIASRYRDVEANLRYFVPCTANAECWTVELANRGRKARNLSIYTLADLLLGNVSLDEVEVTFMALFNEVKIEPRTATYWKRWWHPLYGWSEENGIWSKRVFVTSSQKPDKILTDRGVFFGPFSEYQNPAALKDELLPDCKPSGKEIVAAFQWRIRLAAGETWRTDLAVGIQEDTDSADNAKTVVSFQKKSTYDTAWKNAKKYRTELLDRVRIHTGEKNIDIMANWWNKHQLMVNFSFGRGPSYFHKGQYPAMRDCCQDAFGVIPLDASLAKKNLLRIGKFFFADGRAAGGCNRADLPEGPSVKVDLPLWYVLAVTDYLRETGDLAFLDEWLPFQDGGGSTVYQKMLAGIERIVADRGPRGLPLMGKGDWNDAANRVGAGGKGESVWLGQFLYYVIHQIEPVMKLRGDDAKLAAYLHRAQEVRSIINDLCWDGQWFIRAFKDDGTPLGAHGAAEGYIWINSQTWAVIAGISDSERLNQCMDSVEQHMGTQYGLMNLAPAFTKIDPNIGIITRFRSGWKENAAVFSHASAFNVVARAMLGRGKDAVDLFRRILPIEKDSDTYLVEPYVYSQFCAGPGSEDFGRGAYHWLTGTAAWMFRALTDYIIGVRPQFDGLLISPAVDPTWKKFSLRRFFRGAEYQIEFSNPTGVQTGVKEILLDGRAIQGNLLPLPTAKLHKVKVVMG